MSRFRTLTFALMAGTLFALTPTAMLAQDNEDRSLSVDVDAVEAALAQTNGVELAQELRTPPDDANLPPEFLGATFIDPTVAPTTGPSREQLGVLPFPVGEDAILNIQAAVAYTVEASPAAFGGATSTNSLSYVIFDPFELADDTADEDTLDEITAGVEEGFSRDENGGFWFVDITATVDDDDETSPFEDLEARLVTYWIVEEDTSGAARRFSAAAQLYIVPIGNVFIFSLVTVGVEGSVEATTLSEPAEDLTLTGIEHLATAVETVNR